MPSTEKKGLSWQSFPDRLAENELANNQTASGHDAFRKEITIVLIFPQTDFGLLKLVDVGVNRLERLRISGAIKFALGNARDVAQTGFVK